MYRGNSPEAFCVLLIYQYVWHEPIRETRTLLTEKSAY